jgi:hypothetical protein
LEKSWEKEEIVTLMCIDAVERTYREKEHDAANPNAAIEYVEYKGYKANNGVHPLVIKKAQADYLDTFSPKACCFYLAFAHIDDTDGIAANGIGQHILCYVGMKKSVYSTMTSNDSSSE